MKNFQRDRLWVIPVILLAWSPYFMGAWDKTEPADATAWNDAAGYIRANNTVLESAIGAEHDFNATTQTGVHTAITSTSVSIGTDGSVQGILTMWDKDSNEFPYIRITSPDGSDWFFFVDNTGDLKMNATAPTDNGDGAAVGSQS